MQSAEPAGRIRPADHGRKQRHDPEEISQAARMGLAIAAHQPLEPDHLDARRIVGARRVHRAFEPGLDTRLLDREAQAAPPESPQSGQRPEQEETTQSRRRNQPAAGKEAVEPAAGARRTEQALA